MHRIQVEEISEEPRELGVIVEEGDSATEHVVMVSDEELARYGEGLEVAQLIKATFEFLLERENKEDIAVEFSLSEVERHYPDYPDLVADYVPKHS